MHPYGTHTRKDSLKLKEKRTQHKAQLLNNTEMNVTMTNATICVYEVNT